jgi:hypothetical protein
LVQLEGKGIMHRRYVALVSSVLLCCAGPAAAQETDFSASPFGPVETKTEEVASLQMPKLEFSATPEDANNYDKYYYFHRKDTDFKSAFADISECDGYARGLASSFRGADVPYP